MKKTILQTRREALGLTPEEVAKIVDMYPKRYKLLEAGELPGNHLYLCQTVFLAGLFRIKIDDIFDLLAPSTRGNKSNKIERYQ